jgi:hypothetical protein
MKRKNLGQFPQNYRTFYPKIVTKLSKIWIWDPGKTYPGYRVKKAPDPGSGSATLLFTKLFFISSRMGWTRRYRVPANRDSDGRG